jgi:AraC family transcriptional regulator of adaptative response/methylated-DNA-[protein]-cysteine methyltransferase
MDISLVSPEQFKEQLATKAVTYSHYKTAAGYLQVAALGEAIFEAKFVEPEMALGQQQTNLPARLLLVGTTFQIRVWQAALSIPARATMHYEQLAAQIGAPKAYRAVAHALGQNKIAYFIPCHRVVRKNGQLAGYKWGVERKMALLESER